MKKSLILWALVNRSGYMSTVRERRREVIAKVVEGSIQPWAWWKRKCGLRLVRVRVTEI